MKFPSFNRRSFFQLLFSGIVISGCKKIHHLVALANAKTNSDTPLDIDLGSYTTTEYGIGLVDGPDLNKLIYGYSDKVSYYQGDTVSLYLSAPPNNNQKISLSDANGEILDTVKAPIVVQKIKNPKPWVDGCGFNKTFEYKLPANLKSGIYGWSGNFSIIVKSKIKAHDITIIYPSNTINAYNRAGGKSLYKPAHISTVVSFLRFQYGLDDYTSSFYS